MVSALWKAASEGDLQAVNEFLEHASALDIELKGMCLYLSISQVSLHLLLSNIFHAIVPACIRLDHTGVTPLIEAIKNGHVDVVRALLGKGNHIFLLFFDFLTNTHNNRCRSK